MTPPPIEPPPPVIFEVLEGRTLCGLIVASFVTFTVLFAVNDQAGKVAASVFWIAIASVFVGRALWHTRRGSAAASKSPGVNLVVTTIALYNVYYRVLALASESVEGSAAAMAETAGALVLDMVVLNVVWAPLGPMRRPHETGLVRLIRYMWFTMCVVLRLLLALSAFIVSSYVISRRLKGVF